MKLLYIMKSLLGAGGGYLLVYQEGAQLPPSVIQDLDMGPLEMAPIHLMKSQAVFLMASLIVSNIWVDGLKLISLKYTITMAKKSLGRHMDKRL